MATETLAQKAQRLGIKPAGVAGVQKETLAQKAQRLGIKPAQPVAQPINPYNDTPIIGPLSNVGIGIGTSIGKTGLGLAQLAFKGGNLISRTMGLGNQYDQNIKAIEDIKQKVYTDPFKKELETKSGKTGQVIGEAATYLAPSSKITAGQKVITGLVSKIPAVTKTAQFGRGALGVTGRAVPEVVGAGASSLAITGGDTERAKRDALLAGGFSTAFGTAGSLYRGAKDTGLAKTVLSKTSGIPKSAFDAVGDGINKGATPEIALEKARGSVVGLRSKLTNEWQSAIPKIEEKFIGKVYSMPKEQLKKLVQVADEFGLDETVLPVNIKKITAPEAINLMKGLNELDSLAVKASPKGAIVRQFKKELKDNILNTFGGENGEVSQLWKNYSTKSQILQNMNDIVNTYKTTPRATVTAKNRLMAIFDENKPEFLKAVQDIEKEMGINLTKDVASTKFQNVLPAGILKADGGLPTKSGIVDKLIKALFLPVTSPKIVGKITLPVEREAGVLEKRLFGDYNPKSPSKTIPASTQMPINSPKNINPIKANIPTSSTIKKDLSNKQGGFIKVGNESDALIPKTADEVQIARFEFDATYNKKKGEWEIPQNKQVEWQNTVPNIRKDNLTYNEFLKSKPKVINPLQPLSDALDKISSRIEGDSFTQEGISALQANMKSMDLPTFIEKLQKVIGNMEGDRFAREGLNEVLQQAKASVQKQIGGSVKPVLKLPTNKQGGIIEKARTDSIPIKEAIDNLVEKISSKTGNTFAKADIKSAESIARKLREEDIGGDIANIKDIARNSFVLDNPKSYKTIIDEIQKIYPQTRVKVLDTPLGYKGTIINIKANNGMWGEIQIATPKMMYGKLPPKEALSVLGKDKFNKIKTQTGVEPGLGHEYYEGFRVLEPKDMIGETGKGFIDKSLDYYSKLN